MSSPVIAMTIGVSFFREDMPGHTPSKRAWVALTLVAGKIGSPGCDRPSASTGSERGMEKLVVSRIFHNCNCVHVCVSPSPSKLPPFWLACPLSNRSWSIAKTAWSDEEPPRGRTKQHVEHAASCTPGPKRSLEAVNHQAIDERFNQ